MLPLTTHCQTHYHLHLLYLSSKIWSLSNIQLYLQSVCILIWLHWCVRYYTSGHTNVGLVEQTELVVILPAHTKSWKPKQLGIYRQCEKNFGVFHAIQLQGQCWKQAVFWKLCMASQNCETIANVLFQLLNIMWNLIMRLHKNLECKTHTCFAMCTCALQSHACTWLQVSTWDCSKTKLVQQP